MASRRGNGEGRLRKLKSGGYALDRMYRGERLYASGRTKALVDRDIRDQMDRIDKGLPARDSEATVGAWVREWKGAMLNARVTARGRMKETTKAAYRKLAERHVEADELAGIRLDKLKPSDVAKWMERLRTAGLAESTIRQSYHILRIALEDARKDRMIAANPMLDVKRPVPDTEEARHLDAGEVAKLLEAARRPRVPGDKRDKNRTKPYVRYDKPRPYWQALALIASTGLRRGEALALKWSDVDLVAGTATVRGTLARVEGRLTVSRPKTKRSKREVPLVPAVVTVLAELANEQDAARVRACNLWTDTGFVFTTATGAAVDPRNLYRTMQTAAEAAGLEGVGVHTLRHSVATGMRHESPKVVADLLGHELPGETQGTYTHANMGDKREAVERWTAMIGL